MVKKKRPPFRLVYFNLRGKAELIRLIFIASDIMFEDCRITTSDWTKLKPGQCLEYGSSLNYNSGACPLFTICCTLPRWHILIDSIW